MKKNITYEPVSSKWEVQLGAFFEAIIANKEQIFFHPHPLTPEAAKKIASQQGKDLYFIQIVNSCMTGYAMLRGWDEDFEIPSLGIAIHPDSRKQGLGEDFMLFLHKQAKLRGAQKIRIKVYLENDVALCLYTKLGYLFTGRENEQLIGFLEL